MGIFFVLTILVLFQIPLIHNLHLKNYNHYLFLDRSKSQLRMKKLCISRFINKVDGTLAFAVIPNTCLTPIVPIQL